jgi:hypothetical protein
MVNGSGHTREYCLRVRAEAMERAIEDGDRPTADALEMRLAHLESADANMSYEKREDKARLAALVRGIV